MTATEVQLTTRDGRALHAEIRTAAGERPRPIVVFESGMGASCNMWGAVVPLVAPAATCVTYDRSGLGSSPRDSHPRVLARLADDLVDVMVAVGEGQIVLVGHSWGGPIVRCAAALSPERVVGIVLVDQTDEGCDLFFSRSNERQTRWMRPVMPVLARLGLLRLGVKRLAAHLPEPSATRMIAQDGGLAAVRAQQDELASFLDDLRRLRADPPNLPDVPVTVISGTIASRLERGRRRALIGAHRARAAAMAQGRHVLAERSGHFVPFTEPELVAREIDRLLGLPNID